MSRKLDKSRLDEIKGITMKSLWLRLIGKKKASLDQEEKKFLKDHHDEVLAEKALEVIQAQLEKAQIELTQFKLKRDYLQVCRNEMNELLVNAQSIHVDEKLEKEVVDATNRINVILNYKSKADQCLSHLIAAQVNLTNAKSCLKEADYLLADLYDPFVFPSYVGDSYVYSEIGKASKYLRAAHNDLHLAKSLGPQELPKLTEVHIYRKQYVLYDGFFDEYYTEESIDEDLSVKRAEIKESLEHVHAAIDYMQRLLFQVRKDLAEANSKADLKRSELVDARRRVISQFVSSKQEKPTKDQKSQSDLYKDIFKEDSTYQPVPTKEEKVEEK